MKMITKRDGREEPFNFYKIIDAAKGAYADVGLEMPPELQAEIINTDWPNKIEDIQDELYKHIYKYSRKVAKAFKTYRSARTRARDMNTNGKYYDTVLRVVQGDKTSDVYRENANKDASKLNTMRDLIAGETCKKLYRELVLDPEIMELHDKNIIHIHDMDYRLMKGITNCFDRSTKFITSEGVKSFEDFNDGDIVYVPTHTGSWKKAIVHYYGEREMNDYRISQIDRPNYGITVRATPNHRWILSSGVTTTRLSKGDALLTKNDLISSMTETDILNNAELLKYWCIGFIIGDGTTVYAKKQRNGRPWIHVGIHTMVRLCGNKVKYLDRFLKAGFTKHNMNWANSNPDDVQVYTSKFDKNVFLKEKQYLKLDAQNACALIRGLLAADGHNQKYIKDLDVYIYNGVSSVHQSIQDIIERFAPLAGYYITSVGYKDSTNLVAHMKNPLKTYHFTLQLPKLTKSKKGKIFQAPPLPYKVVDITPCGIHGSWCLEVEDDHSFILDGGIITGNCCLANLQDMLLNGTVMNGKLIRSPHTLRVAATVATQIITAIVGVQYGGITITISALSPFVRRSKEKYEKFVSQYDLPEDTKRRMVEDMLKKEVTDSIQTFQYQLNSMTSTNGRQLAA